MSDDAYLLHRIRRRCNDDAGCWLWTGYCDKGVMPVISINGSPTTVRRTVYRLAVGEIRTGFEVVGTCERVKCVAPEHLKQISKAQRRRELTARRSPASLIRLTSANRVRQGKLTMEKAREIRASDEPTKDLAERYGVSSTLIGYVRRGISWAEPSPFAGLGARP